ncbi:tyrosine-type recombinase/integrase [Sulfurimonas xiamenensis]|uniref:Site-specific integrase n=1 Tax=Sulfurimonas xiamenensis TaxID=2590021 RepID=A0AAJ4DMB8_9BACT|nr:site-specific integrase [Sulfurimonas xiamenensis]QFR42865.1 site-specific integrase [Sulfurimonas xiamenensis]
MAVEHKKTSCKDLFFRDTDDGDIIYYILKPQKNSKEDKEKIIGKKSEGITEEEMCEKWIKKLRPRERYATSKTGVFWRHCTTNGKDDKTYYITYKVQDEQNPAKTKTVETVVGKHSQNVRVAYAHQKYIETVNNLKTGEPVPIKRKKKKYYTLQDAFNEYIKHTKNEKKTWKKDEEIYTNHLAKFHNTELVSLTQADFNDLKNEKLKTHSKRTVQYILAVARQIINYAIAHSKDKEVQRYVNPVANGKVKIKKLNNENTAFFTYEQMETLLKELEKYKLSSSLTYQLTIALLHTGARFSEVATLTWDDINIKEKTFYFKSTKEGNERHVSMSPQLESIIKELPKRGSLVFTTPRGTQILQMPDSWQRTVDKLFPENVITVQRTKDGIMLELSDTDRELLEKQTKKRLTVHSLRHTHASWMAMSGNFTLLEIRDELGHKTTKMTERYAHLMPEARHQKVSALFEKF